LAKKKFSKNKKDYIYLKAKREIESCLWARSAIKDTNENEIAYNIATQRNAFMYTFQPHHRGANLLPFVNFDSKFLRFIKPDTLWFSHDWYYDSCLDLSIRECCMPKLNFRNISDVEKPFIMVHEDASRGFVIDKTKIDNSSNIVNLNGRGNILFDNVSLMFQAKEIHLINSVYALIAYYYACAWGLNTPTYIHFYARPDRFTVSKIFAHAFEHNKRKNLHFVYE
jgi:hypothetical protein